MSSTRKKPLEESKDSEEKKPRRKKVAASTKRAKTVAKKTTTRGTKKPSRKAPAKKVASPRTPRIPRKPKTPKEPEFSPETEGEFYKVFNPAGENLLQSASVTGIFGLKYPIGERTFANPEMVKAGFGIMLFRSVEEARQWNNSKPLYRVRVGKVFDVPQRRLHRETYIYKDRGGKYLFATEDKNGILSEDFSWESVVANVLERLDVENNWPIGTVMTDWVIPVEKVTSY